MSKEFMRGKEFVESPTPTYMEYSEILKQDQERNLKLDIK